MSAINPFIDRIPEGEKDNFLEDFVEILGTIIQKKEDVVTYSWSYQKVLVYAQKK